MTAWPLDIRSIGLIHLLFCVHGAAHVRFVSARTDTNAVRCNSCQRSAITLLQANVQESVPAAAGCRATLGQTGKPLHPVPVPHYNQQKFWRCRFLLISDTVHMGALCIRRRLHPVCVLGGASKGKTQVHEIEMTTTFHAFSFVTA